MLVYRTKLGEAYCDDCLNGIANLPDESIDLVVTSPPFPLVVQKNYGNADLNFSNEEEYVEWLTKIFVALRPKLKESGSIILDLGAVFQKGTPTQSLYQYKVLLSLCENADLLLCENLYWQNKSALPQPAQYLKKKIRLKQSTNLLWWLSPNPDLCKANTDNVLQSYSKSMKDLFKHPEKYIPKKINGKRNAVKTSSWTRDHGGSIPSNLLVLSNSAAHSKYLRSCRALKVNKHPARFPIQLPEFFIKFLTDENDLVVDIFGGSGTTAQAAEALGRRWKTFELNKQFVAASAFRFCEEDKAREVYKRLMSGEVIYFDEVHL